MAGILFDAVGFPWGALFVVVNQVVVIISLTVFFVKGQVGVNKNHIFCGHCVLAVENQAVRMILHDFVMKVVDKKRRSASSPFQRVNQELTEIDLSLVDAPKINDVIMWRYLLPGRRPCKWPAFACQPARQGRG